MAPFDIAFWIFFGACALWVLWGFVRVFLWDRTFSPPRPAAPQRKSPAGGAADSPDSTPGINSASAERADFADSTDTSSDFSTDSGGSDSGGGDSGGGFESGGGDSGGGGSSGSWS